MKEQDKKATIEKLKEEREKIQKQEVAIEALYTELNETINEIRYRLQDVEAALSLERHYFSLGLVESKQLKFVPEKYKKLESARVWLDRVLWCITPRVDQLVEEVAVLNEIFGGIFGSRESFEENRKERERRRQEKKKGIFSEFTR